MSILKDYYKEYNKPKKTRTKFKSFLVRDSSCYEAVYFIIKLEDEKYWYDAKDYMTKKRNEDESYEELCDNEIMEEYWKNNNIKYKIIFVPDDELFL